MTFWYDHETKTLRHAREDVQQFVEQHNRLVEWFDAKFGYYPYVKMAFILTLAGWTVWYGYTNHLWVMGLQFVLLIAWALRNVEDVEEIYNNRKFLKSCKANIKTTNKRSD